MPEVIEAPTAMPLSVTNQHPSHVFAQPVPMPDWMVDHNGKLKKFVPEMDTSKGQVHLLLPSGIGDSAWVIAKYWHLEAILEAQGREVIYHWPRLGTNRVEPYAKLMGLHIGPYLEMENFRDFSGEFELSDFDDGGIFYVHANVHIEHGNPLHENCPKYDAETNSKTWHPWLEFKRPVPNLRIVQEGERPPQTPENEAIFQYADPSMRKPYICVHVGSQLYGDGNYFPRKWAQMIEKMEKVAPVCLIGFSPTGEAGFIEKVIANYTPHLPAVIDRSFATAMSKIVNASAFVGIDDGLTILASYYGVPTLQCYPDWLEAMPGTYEDCSTLHPHRKTVLMPELLEELGPWLDGLEVI